MTETIAGIEYSKPKVTLLQQTGIGTSELAARTCYDSFDNSENEEVKYINNIIGKEPKEELLNTSLQALNNIGHSDLLDTLAWTHFHYSILEHINLTYLIRGTSRGVLQEHARHRIQAISVRSTRYTMNSLLHAFIASNDDLEWFTNKVLEFNMFVITDKEYNKIEISSIFYKLKYQKDLLKDEFIKIIIAKSSIDGYNSLIGTPEDVNNMKFNYLESCKKKRNVGDNFKHLVTDNWKVDMIVTFNLRSLKNYFQLRDSGAAYFGIRWLAQAMKEVTPSKYLDLIVKQH